MPELFPFSPAGFDKAVIEAVSAAWQKTLDKTLALSLDAYNPELLKTQTLAECKTQIRFEDMQDGDGILYWQPTNDALGFFQYPRLNTNVFPPSISMGYQLATSEQREELRKWGH